jgi:hypothetical protein
MRQTIARALLRVALWVAPDYVGPIWRPKEK